MDFEDFVVRYMEKHRDDFVLMVVDENLDVTTEDKLQTISGSMCVENIRKRLPPYLERQMFALIRSANDSTSDVALYRSRAHGFLPKAPIKKGSVLEALAPQFLERFPPSEFKYAIDANKPLSTTDTHIEVASSPLDIDQKLNEIECLFQSDVQYGNFHQIKDSMHELKGDLLSFHQIRDSTITPMIGLINLILVAQSHETIAEKWIALRDQVKEMLSSLEKNFRLPSNTHAIAIDDSKIQRKLISKFFDFSGKYVTEISSSCLLMFSV